MDERTKATVRPLPDGYPRGYITETAGFTVTKTAAGLFRLLCVSVLATDSVPSGPVIAAVRALFERRWDSVPEMSKTTGDDRARVLDQAGYPDPARGSRHLGEATAHVLERYDGDLGNLRQAAGGDGRRLRGACPAA
jgi:hypothetical protein